MNRLGFESLSISALNEIIHEWEQKTKALRHELYYAEDTLQEAEDAWQKKFSMTAIMAEN